MSMFARTPLDQQNRRVEWLVKTLFLMMTVLLIVPVALIMSILIYRGAPALSLEFLTQVPTNDRARRDDLDRHRGSHRVRSDRRSRGSLSIRVCPR